MIALYWLIGIMPLEQHDLWGHELIGTFTVMKLLGLAVVVYALCRAAVNGRLPSFRSAIARGFLVFLAVLCVNYAFHMSSVPLEAYSQVISIAAFFVSMIILVDSRVRLHRCLLAAIAAVAFVSLHEIREWYLYGFGRQLFNFRPSGMMESNYYALITGLWIPLGFIWSVNRGRPRWERIFCLGCLLVALVGTLLASSRGGFLGLSVAFFFLIFQSRHRARNIVFAALLIVPGALWFPGSPLHRLSDPTFSDRDAEESRLVAWRAGARMIGEHPWTGVGLHNFKRRMPDYVKDSESIVSLAHNTYIELAAEVGILGGISFIAVLGIAFSRVSRVRHRAIICRNQYVSNTALGLQAGLISYAISAVFLTAWWDKMTWLLIFSCICLEYTARSRMRNRSATEEDSDPAGCGNPQPEMAGSAVGWH